MRLSVTWRIVVTVCAIVLTEFLVCTVAALPVVAAWTWLWPLLPRYGVSSIVAVSMAIVPSYVLFALLLMPVSACATWVTRARTPPNAELRIANYDWALMTWARYSAAIHLVRVVAGTLFRGSPLWSMYLRLNGAHIGRRAYVNSTQLADHNLLAFGNDVVIGADVHLSGHTVEAGVLKTGRVRLGSGVTIGLGTLVDIDTDVGDGCQVGALSVVPKHARLAQGATYVGAPVIRVK